MRPHSRVIVLSTLVAVGAALTGCATHSANGKRHTVLLGGLVEVKEGGYDKPSPFSFPVNSEKPMPGSKLTGNKVSLLWGTISYQDQ